MRRVPLALVTVLATLALSACTGLPSGADGNLTNGWPALAEAKTPVPAVGSCYDKEYDLTWSGPFDPVPCDQDHYTETAYVGTITGTAASASQAPTEGSDDLATLYDKCTTPVEDYLGGDWHTGRLRLYLTVPGSAAWRGGARWFRCDVQQYTDIRLEEYARTGSVKDGLTGAKDLAITCLTYTDDGTGSVTALTPTACSSPHNGELAGIYTAPAGPWQSNSSTRSAAEDKGCEGVVAHFLGFPGNQVLSAKLGWIYAHAVQSRWELGDRGIRCYVATAQTARRMTGSVKGIKDGTPAGWR